MGDFNRRRSKWLKCISSNFSDWLIQPNVRPRKIQYILLDNLIKPSKTFWVLGSNSVWETFFFLQQVWEDARQVIQMSSNYIALLSLVRLTYWCPWKVQLSRCPHKFNIHAKFESSRVYFSYFTNIFMYKVSSSILPDLVLCWVPLKISYIWHACYSTKLHDGIKWVCNRKMQFNCLNFFTQI